MTVQVSHGMFRLNASATARHRVVPSGNSSKSSQVPVYDNGLVLPNHCRAAHGEPVLQHSPQQLHVGGSFKTVSINKKRVACRLSRWPSSGDRNGRDCSHDSAGA